MKFVQVNTDWVNLDLCIRITDILEPDPENADLLIKYKCLIFSYGCRLQLTEDTFNTFILPALRN